MVLLLQCCEVSLDVSKKLAGETVYRFQSHFFLFFNPTRSVFTLAQKRISEV
ncbi:hypothetical protein ACO2J3_12885 [Leptospira interrogans]|uniref:Uncharacterized protein n=3 Tax=Leptospira interrogans TaxID=173 RepID=M3HHB1_LEPIR|nr:hypothetical protein [Leptospira interrogans]EJP18016.1 hypothetical protein LEP1GSC080_4785 [Leptospira interrogans str. FPW2026]EKO23635.1 hypothetical protein LEP1GSC104_4923 [Leptospira interrogans str. UI 12621]EMG12040.1 hypothetical protein LEP1GSC151_5810 [Leptospira interrogans serovar Grippotyphosa str. LT2186]EMM83643.1 hypothetical protein LEP1GSC037_1136 [Leptospira interrogans str. 2006001854]EMO91944.1 hypothetical protein LEP1GSC109_1174 [Leptospira interrogans str. UI 13372